MTPDEWGEVADKMKEACDMSEEKGFDESARIFMCLHHFALACLHAMKKSRAQEPGGS